jgi:hypothetical protein
MSHSAPQRARWSVLLVLVGLGVAVAAGTFGVNYWRFRTYRSAWPLDLAFFNHQLWNLSHGMAPLTLQPGNFYASEGPEPWRMAQMRLLTFLVLPVYAMLPGVTTLLVVQSTACGLGVWPMYRIAVRRSGGAGWGIAAAALYAVSPPIWLLGTLDFRYLTLGVPLALAAFDALDARNARRYALLAIVTMLTRQVYAVALAVLAVAHFVAAWLGHRWGRRKDRMNVRQWLVGPLLLSVVWLLLDQGWLLVFYGPQTVGKYWRGMRNPAAVTSRLDAPAQTMLAAERTNLGRYASASVAAAVAAPELAAAAAALSYPPLRMGQWSIHPAQHFSRYATLSCVALLAAAAVSFGRLGAFERQLAWTASKWVVRLAAGALVCAAAVSAALLVHDVLALPSAFSPQERKQVQNVLERTAAREGVLAAHLPIHGVLGAAYLGASSPLGPLSSRSRIYDYNQLPLRRNQAGELVPITLAEALSNVDWCILSRPPLQLPPEMDRTEQVRSAVARSGQFERISTAGRVDVYRRRDTP